MPEKKRVNWKRIVIISVCVLLSLILLAVATVGIYATYLMNKISRNPANESKLTPSEVDQILQSDPDNQPMDPSESLPIINDTPLPSDPIPPVEAPKHIINILLIGQDETSGNDSRNLQYKIQKHYIHILYARFICANPGLSRQQAEPRISIRWYVFALRYPTRELRCGNRRRCGDQFLLLPGNHRYAGWCGYLPDRKRS